MDTGRTTLSIWRKSTWAQPERRGCAASSGSETMAWVTSGLHGKPGGPATAFPEAKQESMPNNRRKGERQKGGRESDRLIVPMKAGNAAGGKETTDGRAE